MEREQSRLRNNTDQGQAAHGLGSTIGPWQITGRLGDGGNAVVWEALHSDGRIAALKVLSGLGLKREKFDRFRNEIDILMRLGQRPGILHLIDAYIPENPELEPSWLAMPKATKMREALGDKPSLESIIEAIHAVAETLASLSADGITHRDIKPENMYLYNNKWVISDFGLVKHPKVVVSDLTLRRSQLPGPYNYLAPELRRNKNDLTYKPNYELSDLYALGKTMWVLAAQRPQPEYGEQRSDQPELTISHYYPQHIKAHYLDRILERLTNYQPEKRGSMAQLASDLKNWLQPLPRAKTPHDISDLAQTLSDIRAFTERAKQSKHLQQQQRNVLEGCLRQALAPLTAQWEQVPYFEGRIQSGNQIASLCNAQFDSPTGAKPLWDHSWGVYLIGTYPEPIRTHMSSGFGLQIFDDGTCSLLVAHIVIDHLLASLNEALPIGPKKVFGLTERHGIPINTPTQDTVVQELANVLITTFRQALEHYVLLVNYRIVQGVH